MEVPAHNNYTSSVILFHRESDTELTKKNDSCFLSPLPVDMNVSAVAEQFVGRKTRTVNKSDEVKVFSLKSREYRLGSEKRAAKIPEVGEQCKDVLMVQTKTLDVNKTEFDDFISGKVVIIKRQQTSKTTMCRPVAEACVADSEGRSCARWTNPLTGDNVYFHGISSPGFCVQCFENRTGNGPPCTDQMLKCLCNNLNTWEKLVDCEIPSSTNSHILPASTNGRKKRSTSAIVQTMLYTANEDGRNITIISPAEDGLEATNVLMLPKLYSKQYLLNFGNVCHTSRLSSYPFDVAVGIHEIKMGNNETSADEDDLEEHVILLDNDSVEEPSDYYDYYYYDYYSNSYFGFGMSEHCAESALKNLTEKSVTKEQGDDLKRGSVIFLSSTLSSPCDIKIAVKRQISGGWRLPTKDSSKLWVHLNIHLVQNITCCQNPTGHPTCCQENEPGIWETKNIQPETFDLLSEQLPTKKALFVAGCEDSSILNSVEILTEDNSGHFTSRQVYIQGKNCTSMPDLPIATTSGTGAMFNNRPNVCAGYTGDDQSEQCFELEVNGSWNNHFNWTSLIVYGVSSFVFHNISYHSSVIDNLWLFLPDDKGSKVWAGEDPSLISDIGIIRPTKTSYPCVTQISDYEAFVYSQPKFAWIFNMESNTWTNLPSTIESRAGPACGFLKTPSGTRYVVLAGGDSSSTTEILNLNTNEWTLGPNLEDNLFGGRMVSIGDDEELLLVGGYSDKPLSDIRKLDLENNSWETVGHLTYPRFHAAPFSVPLQGLPPLCLHEN